VAYLKKRQNKEAWWKMLRIIVINVYEYEHDKEKATSAKCNLITLSFVPIRYNNNIAQTKY